MWDLNTINRKAKQRYCLMRDRDDNVKKSTSSNQTYHTQLTGSWFGTRPLRRIGCRLRRFFGSWCYSQRRNWREEERQENGENIETTYRYSKYNLIYHHFGLTSSRLWSWHSSGLLRWIFGGFCELNSSCNDANKIMRITFHATMPSRHPFLDYPSQQH